MNLKELFNKYIKRINFIADFTDINQASGFNHRFSGKGTNEADKVTELTYDDKVAIYDGLGKLVESIEGARVELKSTIPDERPIEFESLIGLKALTEYHHSGGELVDGMPVFLEGSRRGKLTSGKLKAWHIGEVKGDITGYGKYSVSKIVAEVDGKEIEWQFSMVYYKPE